MAGHLDDAEANYLKISDVYSELSHSKVISRSVYPSIKKLHDELDTARTLSDLKNLLKRSESSVRSGDIDSAEDAYLQISDIYSKLSSSSPVSKSLYPSIHTLHDRPDFERKVLELKDLLDTARSFVKKGSLDKADDLYLQIYQTYSDLSKISRDKDRLKALYKSISDLHENLTA